MLLSIEGSGPDSFFTPEVGDKDPVKGHYARISHQIGSIRKQKALQNEPVLLLDIGDFFSGSIFQALGPNPHARFVPELGL